MSKRELIELLTEILGPLPQIVLRHIDILVKQGLTYKDIGRSVAYQYVVLKHEVKDIDKWGIKGLVPIYLGRANSYYDAIKRQQELQRQQVENANPVQEIEVKPLERNRKKRGININEL